MIKQILVLQYVNWKNPGSLLRNVSRKFPVEIHIVKSWKEPIPKGVEFDGLILLGGDSSNDREGSLFVAEEEGQFLVDWLAQEKPCLGFGLGHTLLTETFEAEVAENSIKSIGFIKGHLTHDGRIHPLFQGVPPTFMLFEWHSQSMQTPVPRNIIPLATSRDCVVEAFTIKGRPYIIGLQFENHAAHPSDVAKWLNWERRNAQSTFTTSEFRNRLINEANNSLRSNEEIFNKVIENFIAMIKCTNRS